MANHGQQNPGHSSAGGIQLTPRQIETILSKGKLTFQPRSGGFRIVQLLDGTDDIGPKVNRTKTDAIRRLVYPRKPSAKPVVAPTSSSEQAKPRPKRSTSPPPMEPQLLSAQIKPDGSVDCPHCSATHYRSMDKVRPDRVMRCYMLSCNQRFLARN